MKKLITISLIASLSLAFNIKTDNKELKRTPPITNNVIYSYAPIVKKVIPSVVNISTTKVVRAVIPKMFEDPFFSPFFDIVPQKRVEQALGSGVIISKDGYIVTNNHVVANSQNIYVFDHSGKKYKAKLIGTDPKTDLAVIKIEGENLQPITFADSSKIEVGDISLAIGNPFGLGESVTQGIISALNRNNVGLNEYENFIQTDTAINPGNSGGALVDLKGRLIGINSAILSKSGGNNGIGFAIPSNMVKFVATSLITNGKVIRGFLGVEITDIDKNKKSLYGIDYGVFVNKVMPNSAADEAGLKAGDIIVEVDGEKVKDGASLRNKIAFLGINKKVTLKVFRNGKFITFTTKLKPLKKVVTSIKQLQGATLEETPNGVIISEIKPKSMASIIGLQKNDKIVAVKTIKTKGWVKIKSIEQLHQLLKDIKQGEALIQLRRENEIIIIQI